MLENDPDFLSADVYVTPPDEQGTFSLDCLRFDSFWKELINETDTDMFVTKIAHVKKMK